MDWDNFFQNEDQDTRKVAALNMLMVMTADGNIDENEKRHFATVCQRVGLSPQEAQDIISNPSAVKFTPASDPKERLLQLVDAVLMMLADGKIHPGEVQVVEQIASRLGFGPSAVPKMVKAIVDGIQRGQTRRQVSVDVESFING